MSIPDWAFAVAAERCNKGNKSPLTVGQWRAQTAFHELARTIAEHEEPPVDPLLVEAREIAAEQSIISGQLDQAAEFRCGKWDGMKTIQLALAALKRGIELASKP